MPDAIFVTDRLGDKETCDNTGEIAEHEDCRRSQWIMANYS